MNPFNFIELTKHTPEDTGPFKLEPWFTAKTVDGEFHLTADVDDEGIPIFSRGTTIGNTWSFWKAGDIEYYTRDMPKTALTQYKILHNPEIHKL